MKNVFSHHRMVVLLFSLLCSFSLSSCTFSFAPRTSSSDMKKDRESDVRDAILAYFDEVQGGRLLDAGYTSKFFSGSNPFHDLKFADEQSRAAMQAGMDRISCEANAVTLDSGNKSAECELTITVPNVARIRTDLEEKEDGFYYPSFAKALMEKEAPMKDYEVVFALKMDPEKNAWVIENIPVFAGILKGQYEKLTYDTDYSAALDTVNSLIAALGQSDTGTIDAVCSGISSLDFFPQDEWGLLLAQAIYSRISYTVKNDPQGTDNGVDIDISLTMPDMDANYIEAYNDVLMVQKALKPAILSTIQGTSDKEPAYTYRSAFFTELASRLLNPDALTITFDVRFSLVLDEKTQNWSITSAQTERLLRTALAGYDPLLDLTPQHLQTAIENAAEELFQEGSINQQQQGDINNYFLDVLMPEAGDPFAGITTSGWKDPATGSAVESYNSQEDAAMMYVQKLSSDWSDFTGHIEWYNQNTSVKFYEEDFSYDYMSGILGVYAVYPPEENPKIGWLKPDTYKVIIYLSDGSVLSESTVKVY